MSLVLYSQSFTGDHPDIYIDNGALLSINEQVYYSEAAQQDVKNEPSVREKGEIYIGNAVVSGIFNLQNCKSYHKRSQKRKNYFQKKTKVHQAFKNTSRSSRSSRIIVKIHGLVNFSHRRGGASAFVVISPISHVNKSKIYKESPCLSQMIFIYKDSVIFPDYSTSPVSRLKFFAYSRPPPQP